VTPPDAQEQLQAAIGGQYAIEKEIGRGGMATVYRAHDPKHGRPVAIKVLHADLAASMGPQRFRHEIGIAARLQHPHILSVLDSGETTAGQLWFTMMYVDGESLRDRLRREQQLPLDEADRIAREIALALQYAHEHGIVHRDVKPENVLLTKDGSTLVADFGIARALDVPFSDTGERLTGERLTSERLTSERLTGRGMVVGTPQYMSPEQATGERDVGPRSDVYSLGAVTYEMLAGEPPFTGPSTQAVIAKMMSGQAPSVRRSRPAIPEAVDLVLQHALAPVPADRFASALEFSRALDASVRGTSATLAGTTGATHGRRRVPASAALLILGLLVGAGALFAWRRQEDRVPAKAESGPVGLAVLPFDAVGDSANAYFADGITDEIRGKLSALPALQVIARASSNEYRHTAKTPEAIGRELGVQYLLTGTVHSEQQTGGTRRVRISPELVQVADGHSAVTKWEQSYDTTLADVFDVQAAVANRVADRLGIVLSPPAQAQVDARPTQNVAAYDAYLRARAITGSDPANIRRKLALDRQAVALDSNFADAWAYVSSDESALYASATPNPADAQAARVAADRAITLAPNGLRSCLAQADYKLDVEKDLAGAAIVLEQVRRIAPSSTQAFTGLATLDAAAGRFDDAVAHMRQAALLDPRSVQRADQLSTDLAMLHRFPEARTAAERGLAIDPANLSLIQDRVVAYLGEGNLTGAQAALRDVPATLDHAALVAYMATYNDLYWVLDSAGRALVLTLPPSAFDDDRGTWSIVRAQVYELAGDTARARPFADTARMEIEKQLRGAPADYQRTLFHGLALAYLGSRAAAAREGEHGCALVEATGDHLAIPYCHHVLARLYLAIGDKPHALAQLDTLLAAPYIVSPAWLTIDPTWAPLKSDPHFQQLLAQPAKPPTA
jgi:TolB-like protein/tetratricopeptide (TPR) repeat protein